MVNWREPEINPVRVVCSRWILLPVFGAIPFWGLYLAAAIHARSTAATIVYTAWVVAALAASLFVLSMHRKARRGESPWRRRGTEPS
jgi:hypothetical protein